LFALWSSHWGLDCMVCTLLDVSHSHHLLANQQATGLPAWR